MKDQLHGFLQYMPFIGLAVKSTNFQEHPTRSLVVRLLEAGIIGAVVLYGSVQINSSRIEDLRETVNEMKQDQRDMRKLMLDLRVLIATQQYEANKK